MSEAQEALLRNRAKQVLLDQRRHERSLVAFIDTLRESSKELGPDKINAILNQAASTPEQKAAMGELIVKLDSILSARSVSTEEGGTA